MQSQRKQKSENFFKWFSALMEPLLVIFAQMSYVGVRTVSAVSASFLFLQICAMLLKSII